MSLWVSLKKGMFCVYALEEHSLPDTYVYGGQVLTLGHVCACVMRWYFLGKKFKFFISLCFSKCWYWYKYLILCSAGSRGTEADRQREGPHLAAYSLWSWWGSQQASLEDKVAPGHDRRYVFMHAIIVRCVRVNLFFVYVRCRVWEWLSMFFVLFLFYFFVLNYFISAAEGATSGVQMKSGAMPAGVKTGGIQGQQASTVH